MIKLYTQPIYDGPVTAGQVVPVYVKNSALITIDSNSFSATLLSANTRIGFATPQSTDESDYVALTPAVIFSDSDKNYRQTLGGGNYALRFDITSANVKIMVTT